MSEIADRREAMTLHNSSWKETALHYAVANMTVKAWESYEASIQQSVPVPRFISQLRQKLLRRRSQISASNKGTPTEKPVDPSMPENDFGGQYGWFDPNSVDTHQTYDQQLMFPSTGPPAQDWGFWDGMMQDMGSVGMNGMDSKVPNFL